MFIHRQLYQWRLMLDGLVELFSPSTIKSQSGLSESSTYTAHFLSPHGVLDLYIYHMAGPPPPVWSEWHNSAGKTVLGRLASQRDLEAEISR